MGLVRMLKRESYHRSAYSTQLLARRRERLLKPFKKKLCPVIAFFGEGSGQGGATGQEKRDRIPSSQDNEVGGREKDLGKEV
jgi:hypothetical protein